MTDQEITPQQFTEWRDKVVDLLLASPAGEDCQVEGILSEIEKLMPMAQEEGWLGMEWFLNVLPPEDVDEMEGIEAEGSAATAGKKRNISLKDSLGSDYIGLGTMMQNATDFLGERQREDYRRWKADILWRVEQIETASATQRANS
jgi:origin recognition complex subunit 6